MIQADEAKWGSLKHFKKKHVWQLFKVLDKISVTLFLFFGTLRHVLIDGTSPFPPFHNHELQTCPVDLLLSKLHDCGSGFGFLQLDFHTINIIIMC